MRLPLCALVLASIAALPCSAIDVWITTGDKRQLLKQQPDIIFQPGVGSGGVQINVNAATKYQTISGFGAAMTDSAAWVLQNELSPSQRDKLMRQLFSPENGIGLNYLRVPMGASDFTASGFYTYNDNPPGGTDDLQQHFSIAHDEAYIIPRLQQARELNPELKLIASPWSAPAWMKTNNSLLGGSLLSQWEGSYARYLAKFIEAYAAAGLPIDALTLQNEPLHTSNYPSMSMSAAQQTHLLKTHVGPHFAAEGVDAKVLVYDHNWDNTTYPIEVLNDAAARQYVAGTAFHAYAGNVTAQTTVHNAHPDKDIYFTEITGGGWATNFGDNLVWNFQNIVIGGTRNWAKTALLWNLALDQNSGPHLNGCTDCRGVVTVNNSTGAVTHNEEFYVLGQVTEAVQSGAVRIDSTTSSAINTVAFLNPDGSRALIALNPNATASSFRLVENGRHVSYSLPGKSVATFLWGSQGATFDNGAFDDGGYHQGGGSLDAWRVFGNVRGNVAPSALALLSGDKSLKLSGQFTGGENRSGVSQGITVAPGELVQAEASALIRSAETLAGTSNLAQMKIEFYSTYGGAYGSSSFLGEVQSTLADSGTETNAWLERRLSGVVPIGATEARLVLQFTQSANEFGAVYVDEVSFDIADPNALAGDFNGDGVVDNSDLEVWRADFGSDSKLDADGNYDGVVDGADFLLWQRTLGASAASSPPTTAAPEPAMFTLIQSGVLLPIALRLHAKCNGSPYRRACSSARISVRIS